MECHGLGEEHCCYLDGEVCPFLEEGTVPGRRWACGLYRELGSWDAVHNSATYRDTVAPVVLRLANANCGDWPQKANLPSHASRCCLDGD